MTKKMLEVLHFYTFLVILNTSAEKERKKMGTMEVVRMNKEHNARKSHSNPW